MIKAIFFDVIGTVVDWKGSIVRDLERIGFPGHAANIATEWAMFYANGPFKTSREMSNKGFELLQAYFPEAFEAAWKPDFFRKAWLRLDPWPDTVSALPRLKSVAPCYTLSNIPRDMMTILSYNVGLDWSEILTSVSVGVKKPDPRVYQHGLKLTGVMPGEALMVAAHSYDLRAAKGQGMQTAFVNRGEERFTDNMEFDYVVEDLDDLATALEN